MVTAALAQTLFSIGYVGGLLAAAWGCAHVAHQRGLPKGQRLLYFWLMFDALIHVFLEGPFVWLSLQGRTVETSHGFFASVWQEYSYADRRWAVADAGIVSVELLTVVLTGPLAAYTAWLVLRRDAGYHVWLVLLCGAELYGDYVRGALIADDVCPRMAHERAVAVDRQPPAPLLLPHGEQQVVVPLYLLVRSSRALLRMARAAPKKEA
ncbi:hypothetical protein CBS14141_002314 [Malassezia furfur]|nr:hypothetical protein CBS14141_002314 [Malassezia furfur]